MRSTVRALVPRTAGSTRRGSADDDASVENPFALLDDPLQLPREVSDFTVSADGVAAGEHENSNFRGRKPVASVRHGG